MITSRNKGLFIQFFGKSNNILSLINCDGLASTTKCEELLHHLCQTKFMGNRNLYNAKCVAIPEKINFAILVLHPIQFYGQKLSVMRS